MKSNMYKFIKFALTGGVGLVIDFSITWICKDVFGLNPYIANSIGFFLAVVNNYFLNKYWTFKNDSSDVGRQFLLFLAISSFGLILNTLTITFLYGVLLCDFYLSKIIATALVVAWNFLANKKYTFKESQVSNDNF